ncbi:conserved hypothetical protein [Ricinus communis]|uniref:Uncharacterized protein n=1 Tax=Ricinus communis TaxID=3988 RepID=B9TAN3_RICCO|nr:conserved hypothetical protein [Ricinus communis]
MPRQESPPASCLAAAGYPANGTARLAPLHHKFASISRAHRPAAPAQTHPATARFASWQASATDAHACRQ